MRPRGGLFWQVYATLLISLALVAILGASLLHMMSVRPMRAGAWAPGRAIAALAPPANAPRAQTEAALLRISEVTGGTVALSSPGCGWAIAVGRGSVLSPAAARSMACPSGPVRALLRNGWRLHLDDGRRLDLAAPPGVPRLAHMMAFLLLVAGAVALAAWPVVARIAGRLVRLRLSVEAWGAGQLARRAVVDGTDEIAAVAASFNAAADRADALLAAHRDLLAHASHELRSPLARLRVASEMFVAAPDAALLPAIGREIAELDALVGEILLASRLDHGAETETPGEVDLLALAAEEASRAGVELAPVNAGHARFDIVGSSRLLRRMIRNLIDNAVKHGAPPVEIGLAHVMAAGRPAAALTVLDHGPGIAEPLRERVFEPFFRPDGWSEDAGSWGLGLSLVRQIARRHGGDVVCRPGPGVGSLFVVTLPNAHPGRFAAD